MLAFGSYMPGSSVIHQSKAQVKIVLACAFSICAVLVSSWIALGAMWLAVLVCYCLARIEVKEALAGITPLAFLLACTIVAHVVVLQSSGLEMIASQAGSLGLTQVLCLGDYVALSLDGFVVGLFFAARIALVFASCALLTFTTSQLSVVAGLRWLLRPLRLVKLPVDDMCMVVAMALRFVPLLTEQLQGIKRAREARGMPFSGCGVSGTVRAWAGVVAPLFVSLFRQADIVARAMEARCYGDVDRSSLRTSDVGISDVLACIVGVMLMILIVVLL